MASVSFTQTKDGITAKLNAMVSKSQNCAAFLTNVIYPMYVEAQQERWMTENSSETGAWVPLSTKPIKPWWISKKQDDGESLIQAYETGGYAAAKRILYKGFPGGGNALGIAKGKLSDNVIGKNGVGSGLNRIVTPNSMTLAIDDSLIPYAKYYARIRPVMFFGDATIEKMKAAIGTYLMGKQ